MKIELLDIASTFATSMDTRRLHPSQILGVSVSCVEKYHLQFERRESH